MTQTAIDAEANEVVQNCNVRMLFRAVLKQAIEDTLGRSNRNECSAAVADAVKTSGTERAAASSTVLICSPGGHIRNVNKT